MDATLDERFHGVETALNALVESITTYNPSVPAALSLIAADDSLSESLNQLAEHQANHSRILHLRQTADALDAQIKASIALLAETRKELLSTAAPDLATARDVPFDQLLAYAKRISRFTLPPNYRPPQPKPEEAPQPSIEPEEGDASNGAAEPSPAAAADANTMEQDLAPKGAAYAALTDAQKDWLDQMAKAPFIPWPNEEDMRLGALAAVQQMIRDGKDPWTVLGPEEQAEADARLELEQEEKKKQQAEELARLRRGSFGRAGPARPAEKKESTFTGFELYNPDDEEGDE